jgi:hypothetical protein
MPFSVADFDIHDTGQVDFGAVRHLLFWAVHLISPGPLIHEVDPPSGYLYKFGWVTTGDNFNVIGGVNRWYWREPIRLAFGDILWTPAFTEVAGGASSTLLARGMRWSLSPGTTAWLYALADS